MRKIQLLFIALTLSLISAPFASAHGEIVSTSPEQGSVSTTIPETVTLNFDGNLQTLDGKTINTIDVVDSTGASVVQGEPVVTGKSISTSISTDSAVGEFTVTYRIVSEDGHPVDGSYVFTAGEGIQEIATLTSFEPEDESESQLPIGAIIAIVVIVLLAGGLLLKRKSETK